jgi:antitoxin MazE
MPKAQLNIKKWGNSLGVRLPVMVVRAAGLQDDQRVSLSVENGKVVITPLTDEPLSLAERLARFDPDRHGGEVMTTDRIGAEKW